MRMMPFGSTQEEHLDALKGRVRGVEQNLQRAREAFAEGDCKGALGWLRSASGQHWEALAHARASGYKQPGDLRRRLAMGGRQVVDLFEEVTQVCVRDRPIKRRGKR